MSTRAELSWALKAVLPHVGSLVSTDGVGLQSGLAWATDRHTLGIARTGLSSTLTAFLPTSEAKDLARFLKPSRKAEYEQEVIVKITDSELHVGVEGTEDTAVFELYQGELTGLSTACRLVAVASSAPTVNGDVYPFNPNLLARFSSASRGQDRLWFSQRQPRSGYDGALALVQVGDDFIGAILGLQRSGFPEADAGLLSDLIGEVPAA